MNTPFWTPDANGFSFVSTQVKHSPLFGVMFLIELALIIAVVLRRNKSPLKRRPLALRLTTSIFFACGFLASSLPIPCPPYQFIRTVFGGCAIMFLIGHSVQSLKMIKSKIELFQDIHENVNNSTGSTPTTTSSSSNNNNNNNNGNSNLKHSKSSTPDDSPTTGTSTSTVTNTNSSSSSSQRRDFIVRNQLYALLHSNALRRRSSNDKTGSSRSSSRRPSPNTSSHSSYNFDALDSEAAAAHLDLSRTRPVLALVLLGSLLYTAAYAATNGIVFSLYLNIGPGIDNVRMACPAYVSVASFFAELILLLISESGFVYCIYVSHHFLKGARDALHLRNEMILAACIIPLRTIAALIVWLGFDSATSTRLLLGKLAWALPFLLIDAVTLVFRVFETFKSEANANASLLLMNAADSTVPVPALRDDAFRSPPDSETSGTAGVSSSGALKSSSSTTRRPSPLSNSTTLTPPVSPSSSSSSSSHTALTTTTGTTSTTAALTDSHDDDDDDNNNNVTEVAFPLKEYDHATRSSATHRDTTTESLSPLHQASRSTQSSDNSSTADTLTTPSPSSSSCETIDDSVNATRKPHRRRRKRRSNKPALRDSDERIVPVSRAHRPRGSVPAAEIGRRSQKHKMYTTQPPGCIPKLKRSTSASDVSQTASPTGRKLSRHASDVEHFSRARDMLLPDEKRTQVSISSATTRRRPNKHEFRGETLGDDNDAYVRAKRKHGSSSTTNPSSVSLYSSSTSSNSITNPFKRGRQTRVVAQSTPADSTVREQLRTRLRTDPEFRSQFAMFLTTEFAIENLSFYDDATALHELLTAPNVDLARSEVQRVADGMLNVIRQNYLSRRCRYPVNLPQMLKDKLLSESWRDIDRWLVDALESVLDVMAFDLFVRFKP